MERKYRHCYVPQSLVRNWAEDGRNVAWSNPATGDNVPSGNITGFFHSSIAASPLLEAVADIDAMLTGMFREFLKGDFSSITSGDAFSGREALVFLLLRSPVTASYMEDGTDVPKKPSGMTESDYRARIRTADVVAALEHSTYIGLAIRDLSPVLLKAPSDRSFVIGASPLSVINPYFEERHPVINLPRDPFILWGSVLVLPLSPSYSLCLYDSETYSVSYSENGICPLSSADTEILNAVQIFNSGRDGGVVFTGDGRAVHALENKGFFRKTGPVDIYPFGASLSAFCVRSSASDSFRRRCCSPVRDYVLHLLKYDDDHRDALKGGNAVAEYERRVEKTEEFLPSRTAEKILTAENNNRIRRRRR